MPEVRGWPGRVEHIMGMPISIDVRDPEVDPAALDNAFAWLRWVDATFSTYRSDSTISRLNRGELLLAGAHPDVRAVLERCEELREETGGYFDIRAAGALLPEAWNGAVDPSGFVTGWSVDRAAAILGAAGWCAYRLNGGAD